MFEHHLMISVIEVERPDSGERTFRHRLELA